MGDVTAVLREPPRKSNPLKLYHTAGYTGLSDASTVSGTICLIEYNDDTNPPSLGYGVSFFWEVADGFAVYHALMGLRSSPAHSNETLKPLLGWCLHCRGGLSSLPFSFPWQFIVAEDGSCGLVYEHAPAEGPPIVALLDHIVEYT